MTASSPESNCVIEGYEQPVPIEAEDDEAIAIDDRFFGIAGVTNANQEQSIHSTKILSSWQHPIRHFMAQLQGLKNPRRHSKIKRTLLDVL